MKEKTIRLTMDDAVRAYYLITAGAKAMNRGGLDLLTDEEKKLINMLKMKLACFISEC